MEQLTFNSLGQWTLTKSVANGEPADADYNSYRTSSHEGELPKDYGRKGWAHMGTGVPKKQSKNKMEAKVTQPIRSYYSENHPGQQAQE